jgi:TPP-dependent pyruvate/acetoin dehydrogenase alpha subunit
MVQNTDRSASADQNNRETTMVETADRIENRQTGACPPDQMRHMYRLMWRIRLFEEKVFELFRSGIIRGTAHLYVGSEAVATGACAALRSTDYVTSTHRGHGHSLAKGLEAGRVMAEILGRTTGYCKGKGGSMHVASASHGMLGADGIVGGGTPIAVGAALGCRILSRDSVVVSFFGDGAANQGVLFESMNLASILRLPVIFVCENNLWALSTPTSEILSVTDVAARGAGFNMPGVIVDGQDVLAVYEAVKEAVDRGRAGQGPTLLECKTYRFFTHSAFATREIRSEEEVEHWKRRDPIAILGHELVRMGVATESGLADLKAEEQQIVLKAVSFALASPVPSVAEAYTDVLVDEALTIGDRGIQQ